MIQEEGYEIGFNEGVKLEDEDSEIDSMATSFNQGMPAEEVKKLKIKVINYFLKAAELTESI
jgi:hypothetical protein